MAVGNQQPILASWKISEVLNQHPELIDTLVDLSPAFRKLRNPMLRKVQSRLVTVAQAAAIAGLDAAELTRTLNHAAGIMPPADAAPMGGNTGVTPTEEPEWVASAPVAVELDARPLLERGEEPFRAIMAASREVPAGQALRLTVGFEPLPLYDAMARKGFSHWSRRDGDDVWNVLFYREPKDVALAAADQTPQPSGLDWDAAGAEVTVDVSELVPPEPMVKILQALETLPEGSRLLVHHVRRPMHLYDRLDEMGYAHETREPAPGKVEVLIEKRATGQPA